MLVLVRAMMTYLYLACRGVHVKLRVDTTTPTQRPRVAANPLPFMKMSVCQRLLDMLSYSADIYQGEDKTLFRVQEIQTLGSLSLNWALVLSSSERT